jgi:hypothetical protein
MMIERAHCGPGDRRADKPARTYLGEIVGAQVVVVVELLVANLMVLVRSSVLLFATQLVNRS